MAVFSPPESCAVVRVCYSLFICELYKRAGKVVFWFFWQGFVVIEKG